MRLILALLLLWPAAAAADAGPAGLRIAVYDVELAAKGAGELLADLGKEAPDPRLEAILAAIGAARPHILLLAGFDVDFRGRALDAFLARLKRAEGLDYRYRFAPPGNAGVPSGRDLDGDTLLTGWGDAHGWGRFPGNGAMALVSALPIDTAAARSFQRLRWADLPGAAQPRDADGRPWPDAGIQAARRLSSRAHWDVPVVLPGGGRLHLLAAGPTPPLYDGAEMSNRLRNRDEIRLWTLYLDGMPLTDDAGVTAPGPAAPVVVLGDLAIDPVDGAGLKDGIAGLLSHARLQDPAPASPGAAAAGANARQRGPAALDTADRRGKGGGGNLRLDYVLPDARLAVTASGVVWPAGGALAALLAKGPAHRLVWVDVAVPQPLSPVAQLR